MISQQQNSSSSQNDGKIKHRGALKDPKKSSARYSLLALRAAAPTFSTVHWHDTPIWLGFQISPKNFRLLFG
jgi:hypothetical protein